MISICILYGIQVDVLFCKFCQHLLYGNIYCHLHPLNNRPLAYVRRTLYFYKNLFLCDDKSRKTSCQKLQKCVAHSHYPTFARGLIYKMPGILEFKRNELTTYELA